MATSMTDIIDEASKKADRIWSGDSPCGLVFTTCNHCGDMSACIVDMLNYSAKCRKCYVDEEVEQMLKMQEMKPKPSILDVDDFARI